MSVEILTGFDGSSPHADAGVDRTGDAAFVLRPGWRAQEGVSEEAPGCGSRAASLSDPGWQTDSVGFPLAEPG